MAQAIHSYYMVVFDGTSSYVISSADLHTEMIENDVELLEKFQDLDDAQEFSDRENEKISDKIR